MQPRHQATLTQPLQCVTQHHVANLHVSTHMTTKRDNFHGAIPLRFATTDSKNAKNYTHRNNRSLQNTEEEHIRDRNDRSRNRRTRGTFHRRLQPLYTEMQGFVLRLPPQNKIHATFMQPLQCVLQHRVTNLHLSTHMATPDHNNHAAIPMRSATADSTHA